MNSGPVFHCCTGREHRSDCLGESEGVPVVFGHGVPVVFGRHRAWAGPDGWLEIQATTFDDHGIQSAILYFCSTLCRDVWHAEHPEWVLHEDVLP